MPTISRRKWRARTIRAARDDAVVQDLLVVIDVVDEEVERADALLQAGLDAVATRPAG